MTTTLPISKARNELPTLVENSGNLLNEYIITVKGYPTSVLIPYSVYESRRETDEILSDKKLMKAIKKAEENYKKGESLDWDDVKKKLKINV